MTKNITGHETTADTVAHTREKLRQRAENLAHGKIEQTPENVSVLSVDEADLLLHELRVHQIELEMQNEELRRSQQELETSRARYFELYDLAPVGYLTMNDKGSILEVNLAFTMMVGFSIKSVIKRPFTQFVFSEDQDKYYLWEKSLFETVPPQACELQIAKSDGNQLWVRLVANLAQDADGATVVRAVISDISESKNIERALASANQKIEEASKAKTIFLANMSHELRTPLNTIIGFSEVLQDKLFGPLNKKQETFVENVLNSGRHLLSLINDILDICKVEANKMELELGRINLEELSKGTIAAFSEKARKQSITLSYTIDSSMDGLSIVADGRKMKQILYNLIDNAIKFNRPNGYVSITVQKVIDAFIPPAVQIVVEDTGIGIASEDQSKLFQPFSQLTQSYYDKQTEGTGLGLALTRHLVELHGGTILLRSELGKGCRFIVRIPINPEKSF